ncbi:MAG: hypothetical protein JSR89_01505 [Proteobacteria bacterium]|nr:hypothetical protein [Pseudomonadota bacterium]
MTIIDPHGTLPKPIGGPFDNAFAVDMEALREGKTIELPYVSSQLIIGGQRNLGSVAACKVKVVGECNTPDGCIYIVAKGGQTVVVPVRATHILPIDQDDIGQENPDKTVSPVYPSTITALW